MSTKPTRPVAARASLFAASLALVVAAPIAQAQTQAAQPTAAERTADGNQRINLSGKLRMLSQRIPGMACNHTAGIEAEQSRANLEAAVLEFEAILNGLENGDDALGIAGAETGLRILRDLEVVKGKWAPVSDLAQNALAGNADGASLETLASQSTDLLGAAKQLVLRVVEHHYDRVNTIQSEAFTIDVAGRQRMLAQQMSKNVCLIHELDGAEAALGELGAAHNMFGATLVALQLGMAELGVNAPPNAAVSDGLKVVAAKWADVGPQIEVVMAGERLDDAARAQMFNDLNTLTGQMNEVVQMYVAAIADRKA